MLIVISTDPRIVFYLTCLDNNKTILQIRAPIRQLKHTN